MVLYASDGDGELYYSLHHANGLRLGGGSFAAGGWLHVEEVAVADPAVAEKWRRHQNKFIDDPNVIPKLVG